MSGAITERIPYWTQFLTSTYPRIPWLEKLHFAVAIPLFLFTDGFSVASPSTNLSDSHRFFFPGTALLPVIAETINNMGGRGPEGEGGEPQRSQQCTQPTGFSLPHIWFTVVPASRGKMLSCWKYTWKAALPQRYHLCILITHTLSCLELFLTKWAKNTSHFSHLLLCAAGSLSMGSGGSCLQKRRHREEFLRTEMEREGSFAGWN